MADYEYNGEHSITIGKNLLEDGIEISQMLSRNTWIDWHLIPATRPLVNPPAPNINMITIPGTDGSLDLTDVLAGRATFGNRSGSWTFFVANDFERWHALYSEIMGFLHGKRFQVVLQDDPIYYYEGRLSVNEWRSDPTHSMIVINYNLDPYKKYSDYGENYLWDTLWFGDPNDNNAKGDLIQSYRNIKIAGSATKDVTIKNNYDASDARISISGSGKNKTNLKIYTHNGGNSYTLLPDNAEHNLAKGITNIDVNLPIGTYRFRFKNNDTSQIKVSVYLMGGLL